MRVERMSAFSGKVHAWELAVTQEQINDWLKGKLIQDAMPMLTAEAREFIQTGVTPDEWNEEFKPTSWLDMAELTEKVKKGARIRMLVDLDFGKFFKKGVELIVEENNLNEMEASVFVLDDQGRLGVLPGPRHPYDPDGPMGPWDEKATFELVIEKVDEKLGITTVTG